MTHPPFVTTPAAAQPGANPMNMNNRNFVRGLCLMAIALLFGLRVAQLLDGRIKPLRPGMFP
jgi:hypothetical protein